MHRWKIHKADFPLDSDFLVYESISLTVIEIFGRFCFQGSHPLRFLRLGIFSLGSALVCLARLVLTVAFGGTL